MPLQLLLFLAAAAMLAVYGHPIGALIGTAATVFMAAGLVVALQLSPAPPRGASASMPESAATDMRLIERKADRDNRLGAYSWTLIVSAVALFLSLWWPVPALGLLGLGGLWAAVWWPAELRTQTVTTSIDINRAPADVFAFVSDLSNLPRYWPHYETVEKLTPGPVGEQTRFHSLVRFPTGLLDKQELVSDAIEEIVHYEPPVRLATRVSDKPYRLSPNLLSTSYPMGRA